MSRPIVGHLTEEIERRIKVARDADQRVLDLEQQLAEARETAAQIWSGIGRSAFSDHKEEEAASVAVEEKESPPADTILAATAALLKSSGRALPAAHIVRELEKSCKELRRYAESSRYTKVGEVLRKYPAMFKQLSDRRWVLRYPATAFIAVARKLKK